MQNTSRFYINAFRSCPVAQNTMQDFDLLVAPVQQSETGFKRKLEAREYLKAFETAPVTLLNPQGEGFWNRADDVE